MTAKFTCLVWIKINLAKYNEVKFVKFNRVEVYRKKLEKILWYHLKSIALKIEVHFLKKLRAESCCWSSWNANDVLPKLEVEIKCLGFFLNTRQIQLHPETAENLLKSKSKKSVRPEGAGGGVPPSFKALGFVLEPEVSEEKLPGKKKRRNLSAKTASRWPREWWWWRDGLQEIKISTYVVVFISPLHCAIILNIIMTTLRQKNVNTPFNKACLYKFNSVLC